MTSTDRTTEFELAPGVCLFPHDDTWCVISDDQMQALRADRDDVAALVDAARRDRLAPGVPLADPLRRAGLLHDRPARVRRAVVAVVDVPPELARGLRALDHVEVVEAPVAGVEGRPPEDGDGATRAACAETDVLVIGDGGRGPRAIEARGHLCAADGPPWVPWYREGADLVVGPVLDGRPPHDLRWRDVELRRRSAAPSPASLVALWDEQAAGRTVRRTSRDRLVDALGAALATDLVDRLLAGHERAGRQVVVSGADLRWTEHRVLPVPAPAP